MVRLSQKGSESMKVNWIDAVQQLMDTSKDYTDNRYLYMNKEQFFELLQQMNVKVYDQNKKINFAHNKRRIVIGANVGVEKDKFYLSPNKLKYDQLR